MKYQSASDSDVMVHLRTSIYDMKQLIEFIEAHLAEAEASTMNYNFYTITRLQRELRESVAYTKQALNEM